MKKLLINVVMIAVAAFSLASCDDPAKMAAAADQVQIECAPEVLEAVAGNIDARVNVTFPADFFLPKAILEVTPVLVYEGGEVESAKFVYQGEKVLENYKTVSRDNGASIAEKVHFAYAPGMEKATLVARAKVIYKGKEYTYPSDIKIADGVNTTYMLVDLKGAYHMMADGYQEVIDEKEEAQILYLINSSEVRSSQLKSQDVKDFQAALKALAADSRREVKGTEIVAYASPDGGEALNNKLSAAREKSAQKAFDKVAKKLNAGEVSSKSIGEDWEGFQELVNASEIEDKDLIIRVLSMYSDPAVREREIKNMSSVYTSLAKGILPQLRRARFITSVQYTNYTAAELEELVANNIDVLDEPALLRAAKNAQTPEAKLAIYKQAIKKYNSDKAKYNSACVLLGQDKDAEAKAMAESCNLNKPCLSMLKGVIAMREGKYEEALALLSKDDCKFSKRNQAAIKIAQGKYTEAASLLEGIPQDKNAALACILTGQLDKAVEVNKANDARASYLNAIVAARQGNANAAKAGIEAASKCEKLAARAAKDVEFAKVK